MKPVAIFQFAPDDRPAYFVTYLAARSIPYRLIRLDRGEPVPAHPSTFAGLALLGGPMSANDPLPWIAPIVSLLRLAVTTDVPVIGHCLGGQLMARAMGGIVTKNARKEIGWGTVHIEQHAVAREWLGATRRFDSFHWHGETFTLPPAAIRIAASAWCANQAFVCGPHLAMQCHVEVDEATVRSWCEQGAQEIAASGGQSVQTPEAMLAGLAERVTVLHRVTDRLYDRWVVGLRP